MRKISKRLIFPILGAITLLAACTTPPGAIEGYRDVDARDGLIVLDGGGFKGMEPKRVTHLHMFQRQEYALFEKGDARAEMVLVQARHFYLDTVAVNFNLTTPDVIKLWNAFKDKPVKSMEAAVYNPGWTGFWVRPFISATDQRSCIAFTAEWDTHGDDPLLRPDKVMFGYYCTKQNGNLSEAQIEDVIRGIGVRGVNRNFRPLNRELNTAPDPAKQASLSGLAKNGTDAFPFEMAESYTISGGCSQNC